MKIRISALDEKLRIELGKADWRPVFHHDENHQLVVLEAVEEKFSDSIRLTRLAVELPLTVEK